MKKHLLTFLFLSFFINSFYAQVAVLKATTFVDSISQPGLKKYGTKITFDGINVPVIYETFDIGLMTLTGSLYGDSLPNLANSSMSDQELGISNFFTQAYNANNTNEYLGGVWHYPVSKNLLSVVSSNSPNGLNCDGSLNIFADSNNFVTTSTPVNFSHTGGSFYFPAGNINFNSLCSGSYDLIYDYTSPIGDTAFTIMEYMTILAGQYAFPSATGLNIEVNVYKQTTGQLCNGKARASITNNSQPFLCAFDNGNYTSIDSIANLCEGMHSVKIATANDTVGKYFIVSNSDGNIDNPNTFGPVIDTIIYNYSNCHFNYNMPIDSAFLFNHNVIDSNTIFFSWQIWQQGVSTLISDTISFTYQTGNNLVSLVIFCGNGRLMNTSNMVTYRINDYAFLSNTTTGVKKKDQNSDISIYPNPFSDQISIRSTKNSDISNIELFNILGEKVLFDAEYSAKGCVMKTGHLNPGFYTISLDSGSNKKCSFKLIKQ